MAWQPVSWIDLVNTSAAPNANDLSKVGGINGAYDADAISSQQIASAIAGAGFRLRTFLAVGGGFGFGLSHDNPDRHYNSIDFCFLQYLGDLPGLFILENGVEVWGDYPSDHSNELFEIKINAAGQIEYYAGGILLYTSAVAPIFPLFVDCSLDTYGLRLIGVEIETGFIPPVVEKIDHMMLTKIH